MDKLKKKAQEAAEALTGGKGKDAGTCPTPPLIGGTPPGQKSAKSKPPGRPMKFPYTMSAKIVHFPWKYYFNNNWVARYYVYAIIASFPIFVKIHNIFNSPGNVAKWEELQRKQHESEHDH